MAEDREQSDPKPPSPAPVLTFAVRARPKFREVVLPPGPAPLDRLRGIAPNDDPRSREG